MSDNIIRLVKGKKGLTSKKDLEEISRKTIENILTGDRETAIELFDSYMDCMDTIKKRTVELFLEIVSQGVTPSGIYNHLYEWEYLEAFRSRLESGVPILEFSDSVYRYEILAIIYKNSNAIMGAARRENIETGVWERWYVTNKSWIEYYNPDIVKD